MADNSKDPFHDPEDKSARFAQDQAALEVQAAAGTKPAPHEGHGKADAPAAALEQQAASDQSAMSEKEQAALAVANDPAATPEQTIEAAQTALAEEVKAGHIPQAEAEQMAAQITTAIGETSRLAALEERISAAPEPVRNQIHGLLGQTLAVAEGYVDASSQTANAGQQAAAPVEPVALAATETAVAASHPAAEAANENVVPETKSFAAALAARGHEPKGSHAATEVAKAEQASTAERGVA